MILVTDGETIDSGLASVVLLVGVVLLVPGFAVLGWWLVGARQMALRVAGAAGAVVAFFMLFELLDTIGKNFVDDASYWQDEMGIVLMALVGAALAAAAATWSQRDESQPVL